MLQLSKGSLSVRQLKKENKYKINDTSSMLLMSIQIFTPY